MAFSQGPYIDLKNVNFFVEDGYSYSGAVNFMAGYSIGATSVVVDGFTVTLAVGVVLTFAGHATEYTIVSTTETSSVTTAIVFTPALTAAVVDNEVVHAGPHRLEIIIGEGNLTYDEKVTREYKKNRGLLDQVRNGDEEPIDVSLEFAWTYLKSRPSATVPTFEEFLKRAGPAAAYVSTGGDCEPYAVNLKWRHQPPVCNSETYPVEVGILPQFRYESLNHDAKAGKVATAGKCNAKVATLTRLAA